MSLPAAVFLDTSILEGQGYNFQSVALKSFVDAARRQLVMLLPHPTEQEVNRHLKHRAHEAAKALRDIRRKAPFLASWKYFPPELPRSDDLSVVNSAHANYKLFLSQFDLKRLGYDAVDLKSIMWWYDVSLAPFGEKSKRKEFPDAFAVSMLEDYARKHKCIVAVVSADGDFKEACNRYSSLLYFQSLPSLTELLLADPARIELVKAGIMKDPSLLEERLANEVAQWTVFTHERRRYKIKESKVHQAEMIDIKIIGLGAAECTLTFDATVEAEHLFSWSEWDGEEDDDTEYERWLLETARVSGTAKVALDTSFAVTAVVYLEPDDPDIKLTETPSKYT
jgi:hypothetical protein